MSQAPPIRRRLFHLGIGAVLLVAMVALGALSGHWLINALMAAFMLGLWLVDRHLRPAVHATSHGELCVKLVVTWGAYGIAVGAIAGAMVCRAFTSQLFDDRFIGFPGDELLTTLDAAYRIIPAATILCGLFGAWLAWNRCNRNPQP